jgi:hypothetical protein
VQDQYDVKREPTIRVRNCVQRYVSLRWSKSRRTIPTFHGRVLVDVVVIRKYKAVQVWDSRRPKDTGAGFTGPGFYMLRT